MDAQFGFEILRQRGEDLLREAEQSRLVRVTRGSDRSTGVKALLNSIVEKFNGNALPPESGHVVVHRGAGRNRRCKSKVA